jgi:hypothetical protein
MYLLIESRAEIASAYKRLNATIKREFEKPVAKDIGWQGGRRLAAKLRTSEQYWYWSTEHRQDATNPRQLNWFGVFDNRPGVQIAVEINTPYEGRNGSVAGFFARNTDTGRIYLFHTGRVGGGAKGVSKEAFLAWSGLEPITISDSEGKSRDGILVMPVEGAGATRSLVSYVQRVIDFKSAVRAGEPPTSETKDREKILREYFREAAGRRKGKRYAAEIDYLSRHGEVVDALANWRTGLGLADGEKLTKNVLIDLGVKKAGKLTEVYEVKTSTARGDIYTAIGQLTVHSAGNACRRFMVLPADEHIAKDLAEGLVRSGIELKRFRLSTDKAEILT